VIPDAAVEAAHNAIIGGNEMTGPDIALDFLSREQVRRILEAAAPHMLAEAKADAWDEGKNVRRCDGVPPNPYRSQA